MSSAPLTPLTDEIDVIDIGPFVDGSAPGPVIDAVGRANEEIGFLVVTGHGIGSDTVDPLIDAASAFFALPLEEKRRSEPDHDWWFRGYQAMGVSALGRLDGVDTPPDLCELFRIGRFESWDEATDAGYRPGREQSFVPNIWPDACPELRPAMRRYYDSVTELADRLLTIFALALHMPADHFTALCRRHVSDLYVNHYPAQDRPPVPGQLRRGPHSDFGTLTVLHVGDEPGGLQVESGGGWLDVPHVPGAFVINIGDLMARWTNDRWVSTRHRVVNPPPDRAAEDRLSIPYFHTPDYDTVVECLPTCLAPGEAPHHPPITAGEWALQQNRRNVGAEEQAS